MLDTRYSSIVYQSEVYVSALVNRLVQDKRKYGKARESDWKKADLIISYLEALQESSKLTEDSDTTNITYILECLCVLCNISQFPTVQTLLWSSPSINLPNSNALPNGQIFIGNASNIATPQPVSGAISLSNTGVVTLNSGIIVDANINSAAAISLSKLATLPASRLVVTDGAGVLTTLSSPTLTEVGYLSGVTSGIQTQINTKITEVMTSIGDIIIRNGANVTSRLGVGSSGQVLKVSGGLPSWQNDFIGTVTSVAATQPAAGLTIAGSPITASGTLTFALANDLAALEGLSATGIARRTGSDAWSVGGAITVAEGGTNITSYTTGDILYASSSTVLNKLAAGTSGQVLKISGGLPIWGGIPASGGDGSIQVSSAGILASSGNLNWDITQANILAAGSFGISLRPVSGGTFTIGDNSGIQALQIVDRAVNIVPASGDKASPANGDIWYNSTTNKFRGRQNGSNVDLVTPGGVTSVGITAGTNISQSGSPITSSGNITVNAIPSGSNTQIQFNNSGAFGGSSSLTWDGSKITIGTGVGALDIFTNSTLTSNQTTLSLIGGNGVVSTYVHGNAVNIVGGNGYASGNTNGGNVNITLGSKNGSGTPGNLVITNLPTSSAGLPSGAVWNNSGVLTIV